MSCEEHQRGSTQSPLFVTVYRLRRRNQSLLPAASDFDKDDAACVAHDEIQLSVPAAKVLRNQLESVAPQPAERQLLGVAT